MSIISYQSQPELTPIDRADLRPSTKAQYKKAIYAMMEAGVNPTNHSQLQAYVDGLKSSSKQFLKSALRIMTDGVRQNLLANSDGSHQVVAALHKLEAMDNAVIVEQPKGEKSHLWLSRQQVEQITALCDDSVEGKRDWIVLGLLLGAGLRREELAELTFDNLKQQPTRNGQPRYVLDVHGKGAKDRVVPLSETLARRLLEWQTIVNGGNVARSFARGKLGDSLSAVGIFGIVSRYGAMIGLPELAPHDMRRTYAQLAYEAGIPLTQVSTLLGHSSVATTQRYLNLSVDLEVTASDAIPLSGD